MTATPFHLLHDHDPWLLLVAAVFCHASALAALDILGRARLEEGRLPFKRLVVAGITFGFGIWAAHFIALLAFAPFGLVRYEVAGTLASIAVGIAGSTLGLGILAGHLPAWQRRAGVGLALGATIAALHFTGMAAVRLDGRITFEPSLVIAAFIGGAVLSGLAAVVPTRHDRGRRRQFSAFLFAAAIAVTHMTAMAGIEIVHDGVGAPPAGAIPSGLLAIIIAAATLVVIALGTGASLVDDHLASRAAAENARFRQLTAATFEGIVVHRDGAILDVNAALTRLVGRAGPALVGRPLTDILPPEVPARLATPLGSAGQTRTEIDMATPAGLRRVEIFTREADHDGRPARISAFRDITERSREEILSAAEQRMLTAIAEDGPLADTLSTACAAVETVIPGAACTVLLIAEGGRQLVHVAAASIPQRYCAAIDGTPIGPAAGSCGTAAWSGEEVIVETIATDPLWRDHRHLALPHGLAACWSVPLRSKGGEVLGTFATYHRQPHRPSEAELQVVRRLAAASAIAIQRKRQDAALVAEKEKAQAASRAKSEFLASMSHELRTPLNAILGFSEVIEHQLLGPDEAAKYADYAADIHKSGRHLLDLINDLLDVARIEAGKIDLAPEPCDVAAIAAERIAMVRQAFPDAARIALGGDATCPPVQADKRALSQVLLNIIGNAAKFTPRDGRIDVLIDGEAPGLRIHVADNGPGIPPELLEDLGQAFKHGEAAYSRRYGGTGLGLHISRALAEAHGGRLTIVSTVGHGTKVTLVLPETMILRRAETRPDA